MSMDEHDIEWRCECGHVTPDYWEYCVGCGKYRYYGEKADAAERRKKEDEEDYLRAMEEGLL